MKTSEAVFLLRHMLLSYSFYYVATLKTIRAVALILLVVIECILA